MEITQAYIPPIKKVSARDIPTGTPFINAHGALCIRVQKDKIDYTTSKAMIVNLHTGALYEVTNTHEYELVNVEPIKWSHKCLNV